MDAMPSSSAARRVIGCDGQHESDDRSAARRRIHFEMTAVAVERGCGKGEFVSCSGRRRARRAADARVEEEVALAGLEPCAGIGDDHRRIVGTDLDLDHARPAAWRELTAI
jgi:hypothetical protein